MGMISEGIACSNAGHLEKILRQAILSNDKEVWKYANDHIIPLYESYVGDSWGTYKIPDDLREGFNFCI